MRDPNTSYGRAIRQSGRLEEAMGRGGVLPLTAPVDESTSTCAPTSLKTEVNPSRLDSALAWAGKLSADLPARRKRRSVRSVEEIQAAIDQLETQRVEKLASLEFHRIREEVLAAKEAKRVAARKVQVSGHRRRTRELGAEGSFTDAEFEEVCKRHLWACAYCHRPTKKLTADHAVPLARGGTNRIENIVPACRSCNSSKGTKSVEQYREYRGEGRSPDGIWTTAPPGEGEP